MCHDALSPKRGQREAFFAFLIKACGATLGLSFPQRGAP